MGDSLDAGTVWPLRIAIAHWADVRTFHVCVFSELLRYVTHLQFILHSKARAHETCLSAWSMRLSTSEPDRANLQAISTHTHTHDATHDTTTGRTASQRIHPERHSSRNEWKLRFHWRYGAGGWNSHTPLRPRFTWMPSLLLFFATSALTVTCRMG